MKIARRLITALLTCWLVAWCAIPLVAAAPADTERLQFLDDYVPGTYMYRTNPGTKAWTDDEKAAFRECWTRMHDKLPGLADRAIAYRPIRLYRVASVQGGKRILMARYADYAILISDQFVERLRDPALPKVEMPTQLTHEITHLVDLVYRISWGPEWVAMTKPRLERVRARFEKETGEKVSDYLWESAEEKSSENTRLLKKIAREEGLARGYAALNLQEALADGVASAAWVAKTPVPPEMKEFVHARFWSEPWQPDPVDRLANEGLAALYAGRLDEAIAAFNDALARDPDCLRLQHFLGMAYAFHGNADRALAQFTSVIDHAPFVDGPALQQRAIVLYGQGKRTAALADCRRILDDVSEPDLRRWAAERVKAFGQK